MTNINTDDVIRAVEDSMTGLGNPGFCTACGERVEGVEPDARGYDCECCGETGTVCGAEELLLGGLF